MILFEAFSSSDFFGKLIFLGLFSLSCLCWLVLLQKIFLMQKVRRAANKLQAMIQNKRDLLLQITAEELLATGETIHPFKELYLSLRRNTKEILEKNLFFYREQSQTQTDSVFLSHNDIDLIANHLETVMVSQTKELEKNLFILSTIVSLAPFVGILGTVWGILISLGGMQQGSSMGSSSAILSGLSTALATTVLGLVIAIPALISYNYLKNSLRNFCVDMQDFTSLMLSTIEMQYRKVDLSL